MIYVLLFLLVNIVTYHNVFYKAFDEWQNHCHSHHYTSTWDYFMLNTFKQGFTDYGTWIDLNLSSETYPFQVRFIAFHESLKLSLGGYLNPTLFKCIPTNIEILMQFYPKTNLFLYVIGSLNLWYGFPCFVFTYWLFISLCLPRNKAFPVRICG